MPCGGPRSEGAGYAEGVRKRLVWYALVAASAASAAIIQDVRAAIAVRNFSSAEEQLTSYRKNFGTTPEYIAALSWLGRGALEAKAFDRADAYSKETYSLSVAELKKRALDRDPYLPVALGAAIEVEAQVLAARGERSAAVAYLRGELAKYANTSVRARIQKNINLLSLEGKPAPALDVSHFTGPKPAPLSALKGKPVVLFFWAHWCSDCKAQVPLLAGLEQEFAGRFYLLGPTQHYGYVAQGEEAPAAVETEYIEEVRKKYYARLASMPVPISEEAFRTYGASTTPTYTLVDRLGIVRLYHPGALTYDELKAALLRALR